MAVAYRSSSSFAEDLVSTVVVPIPSGAAVDDIALVGLGRWTGGTFGTITPPTGFTLVTSQEDSDNGTTRMEVWVKRLAEAESGSWVFANSVTDWSTAAAILLSGGVTSGDPIEDTDTAATSADGTWPTTSVTVATAAFLGHFGRHDSSSGSGTPPTDFNEAVDIDWMKANYRALSTTGTFNASGGSVPSGQLAVVLVAVEAEPSGGEPASGSFDVADVVTVGFVGARSSSASFAVADIATVEWTAARESVAAFAVDDVATVTWVGSAPSGGATFDVSDVATVEWSGARDSAATFAVNDTVTVAWSGPSDTMNGEPVGMIVGTVTGPSRKVETVTGPAVRRVVTGPAVRRKVTGPSLAAFAVDGPSRHVDSLDGPDLSRLITGPDVARTLTGPGK